MNNKKSVIIYTEWIHFVNNQTDKDVANLFKAILKYPENNDVKCDNVVWNFVKKKLDENITNYQVKIDKYKEAGRLGGLKRASNAKQNQAMLSDVKQPQANQAVNVNVNVNKNDNKKDKELDKEFNKLWLLYPNKKGKDKARTVFLSLISKEKISIKEIEHGIKCYSEEVKDQDSKYIKHGDTFFRNKVWQDYEETKISIPYEF